MHVPARLTHQTAPTSLFSIEMRRLFLREKINQRLFAFRNYGKEPYCGCCAIQDFKIDKNLSAFPQPGSVLRTAIQVFKIINI